MDQVNSTNNQFVKNEVQGINIQLNDISDQIKKLSSVVTSFQEKLKETPQ